MEEKLFDWAPRQLAESWDNVGQLVGDPGREVRRVLVSLDITEPVVQEAVEGGFDLIVSHHPVMNCTWLSAGAGGHFRHLYAHQSGRGGRWRQ